MTFNPATSIVLSLFFRINIIGLKIKDRQLIRTLGIVELAGLRGNRTHQTWHAGLKQF